MKLVIYMCGNEKSYIAEIFYAGFHCIDRYVWVDMGMMNSIAVTESLQLLFPYIACQADYQTGLGGQLVVQIANYYQYTLSQVLNYRQYVSVNCDHYDTHDTVCALLWCFIITFSN